MSINGASDQTAAFDQLVEEYFRAWFRYHPEAAVEVGVDAYADRLPALHDDDIGALIALNEKLLSAIKAFPTDVLDRDRQLDCKLLYGAALIELHESLEQDWRSRDPLRYLPMQAIFQLTVRPISRLDSALLSRLEKIPDHLHVAREHLSLTPESIPPSWCAAAWQEAGAGVRYFKGLSKSSVLRELSNLSAIGAAAERAAQALQDYATFLQQLLPKAQGETACGEQAYLGILSNRHFLDIDAATLRAFGTRLVHQTEQQMQECLQRHWPGRSLPEVLANIRNQRPPESDLVAAYAASMQAARQFVLQQGLVRLPAHEQLRVMPTPDFLRPQIPFAAYWEPSPNDPRQVGYYYVTPPQHDEDWQEHNQTSLAHTSVHEAWPGHHLQFVSAHQRRESRTLARLLNPSATLYEGWALYCEQLMWEEGFLDRPENELLLLRDRLWRALRVILDVDLHVYAQDPLEAAQQLVERLGFSQSQASAEILWYTRAPGVPMGYATGWAMIDALREYWRSNTSDRRLADFHDRVIGSGSLALPLVIRRQFGDAAWQAVRRQLFEVPSI